MTRLKAVLNAASALWPTDKATSVRDTSSARSNAAAWFIRQSVRKAIGETLAISEKRPVKAVRDITAITARSLSVHDHSGSVCIARTTGPVRGSKIARSQPG